MPDDRGCPALWVGDRTGHSLARSAAIGHRQGYTDSHRLDHTGCGDRDGVGRAAGYRRRPQRGLIVNTHTDGPNVPEENGALGMLALAQYFAERQRRRDLYFVMVTGHFQLAQPQFIEPIPKARDVIGKDAISRWMVRSSRDLPERARWRNDGAPRLHDVG